MSSTSHKDMTLFDGSFVTVYTLFTLGPFINVYKMIPRMVNRTIHANGRIAVVIAKASFVLNCV